MASFNYQQLVQQVLGGGLLSPDQQQQFGPGAAQAGGLNAGLAIMAASAPGQRTRPSLGGILYDGLQAGQQGYQNYAQNALAGQARQQEQDLNKTLGGMQLKTPEEYRQLGTALANAGKIDRAKVYLDIAEKMEAGKPKTPNDVLEYEYAKAQGFGGTFQDWTTSLKRAGATNVSNNVNVSTERKFGETIATKIGDQVAGGADAARGAVGTISTVNRIREALDSGAYVGPGAGIQQVLAQVGSKIGVTGKDTQETLDNTRRVVQGLSQLNLDAAAQMRGQGQITEGERALLERSVGGKFNELTATELRQLLDINDKVARFKITQNQQNLQRLQQQPGMESMTPYFDVPAPPPYQAAPIPQMPQPAAAPASAPRVVKWSDLQ